MKRYADERGLVPRYAQWGADAEKLIAAREAWAELMRLFSE